MPKKKIYAATYWIPNALCDIDIKNSVYNIKNIGNLSNIKIELNMSPKFNKTTELVRDWRS